MSKLRFEGNYGISNEQIEVGLTILEFEENGIQFIYSPALDITGYGENKAAAKSSFNETLGEFFRYAVNKGTLEAELERLGWQLSGRKRNRKYQPPYFDELLTNNAYLSEIVRNKEFTKINSRVGIPVA